MAINKDLEKRILTTNEAGLIAILLERLIDNFKNSKFSIDNKEYDKLKELNNNSRDILSEIIFQFSGDDEISSRIREVSMYVNKLITEGQLRKESSYYDTSIKVLKPLLEGFQQLEVREKPKVTTGLTYGRESLGEYSFKKERSFKA
ncbi:MAG: hypothetical protein GXZ06_07905 [Tissierellia bacterium]|nr:hypothetical protein [Tissierellia bacterium]